MARRLLTGTVVSGLAFAIALGACGDNGGGGGGGAVEVCGITCGGTVTCGGESGTVSGSPNTGCVFTDSSKNTVTLKCASGSKGSGEAAFAQAGGQPYAGSWTGSGTSVELADPSGNKTQCTITPPVTPGSGGSGGSGGRPPIGGSGGGLGGSGGGLGGSGGGLGGSGGGLGGSGGGGDTCDACVGSNCSTQLSACQSNPTCLSFVDCWMDCTDDTCVNSCAERYSGGVQDAIAVLQCMESACASACGTSAG